MTANRLARVCAYSAQAPEWEEFVRLVTPGVALAARRVSAVWGDDSVTTTNEIVQEVFLKLCENERRILREFEDRGNDSFLKLMRMVTSSVATDYFRRIQAEKRGGRSQAMPLEPYRPAEDVSDEAATEAVQRPTLIAQLDGLLQLHPGIVSERDRAMFWLYYRQGLTAAAISRIPSIGLTPKGVESALSRLTRLLRESIAEKRENRSFVKKKLQKLSEGKGISPAIAIDSVKDR